MEVEVGVGEGARVAMLWGEALRWGLVEGAAVRERVPVREREAAGLALPSWLPEGVTVRVAATVRVRETEWVALRRALAEGEQEGASDRPVVVQPPQGQGMGTPLPAGQ